MKVKPKASTVPRLYESSRGPVPSVTDVLKVVGKPYFERWRQRVGPRAADRASLEAVTFGTKVHAMASAIALKDEELVNAYLLEAEAEPYAKAIGDFLGLHVAECLETERALVSDRHGFGGTLDLYCRLMDGSYAVIDWKTTSSLTREHGLQTAAYALLCREHGMTVNRRIVVRIKKEAPGLYYARTYADHAGDVEAFLALKTYWHWAHRSKLERAA